MLDKKFTVADVYAAVIYSFYRATLC